MAGHRPEWSGGDARVIRQHATRTPPRAKMLKAQYWKSRRLADALGIWRWTPILWEHNRTAHASMKTAQGTEVIMEWNPHDDAKRSKNWAVNTVHVKHDISEWLAASRMGATSEADASTV
ncbi:hypothetical protein PHYPSEUDO_006483 [Phytophthora pseudosyringae]|uniref:Uncharacterized protein n=1 Tax=Phytophthora pseudosyringae TaxID=221518 RepID=A0A8T1VIL1_9STRA|nr:hypothetical protein PHYPSEUDO_006483 [Phytophthora pseudosyringae]